VKKLVLADLQPLCAIGTNSAAGNDEVNVRMIRAQVTTPGMQYAKKSDLVAAKVLGALQQRLNRLAARSEERPVAFPLMSAQQWTQLLRNRKGNDKMLHWQQFFGLPGQPA